MAGFSLTETAYYSRKAILYCLLGAVALSLTIFFWQILANALKRPAPPAPPTLGFGRLPEINFPKQTTPTNLSFTLETPDGQLPVVPTQAKVYFIPQPSSGFLNLDTAKSHAAGLGFINSPTKISDTTYLWTADSGRSLTINIVTGDLIFSLDPAANSSLYTNPRILPLDEAAQTARDFLTHANSLPADLATGTLKYTLLKVASGKLVAAIAPSETQFILVSFQRQDYNGLQVLPPDPTIGPAWVLVSNSTDAKTRVANAQYHLLPADKDRFETYPTKPIQQAWNELTSSHFFLAHVDVQHTNQIAIRRISLNYFDPQNTAEYLAPIYVFEGDSGFIGYVSALSSSSLAP